MVNDSQFHQTVVWGYTVRMLSSSEVHTLYHYEKECAAYISEAGVHSASWESQYDYILNMTLLWISSARMMKMWLISIFSEWLYILLVWPTDKYNLILPHKAIIIISLANTTIWSYINNCVGCQPSLFAYEEYHRGQNWIGGITKRESSLCFNIVMISR